LQEPSPIHPRITGCLVGVPQRGGRNVEIVSRRPIRNVFAVRRRQYSQRQTDVAVGIIAVGPSRHALNHKLRVGNIALGSSKETPMAVPTGLNHVAMSVPSGTLTDGFRAELLELYGRLFDWSEIESLRLPDRLTISWDGTAT